MAWLRKGTSGHETRSVLTSKSSLKMRIGGLLCWEGIRYIRGTCQLGYEADFNTVWCDLPSLLIISLALYEGSLSQVMQTRIFPVYGNGKMCIRILLL